MGCEQLNGEELSERLEAFLHLAMGKPIVVVAQI